MSAFGDESVVWDVLDALAVNLDGQRAAPEYFSRRRRVLHRVLGYAVRMKRLDANPMSKPNLPATWTAPEAPEDAIDPRCVGSPVLIAEVLICCGYVGRTQGPRFVAFFGCLKGRNKGRPNTGSRVRRPTQRVPIPPEMVRLRDHLDTFGTGRGGLLSRSQNGTPIQPSTWWRVWQRTRALVLTPDLAATPLLSRPYDLRHSGVTWRLGSGVNPPEVAAWAGHSVEVLMRVCARCMTGMEHVWIARMDQALHLGDRNALEDHSGVRSEASTR